MKKFFLTIPLTVLCIIASSHNAFSFTNQITLERILHENKNFITFINVSLTNFAADLKEKFKSAYGKYFNADIAFLQSDYKRAYKDAYASEEELAEIYEDILRNFYLEDSKNILDSLAPIIIRSKNPRARLYLTLGYRDRTASWSYYTMGNASSARLHSYRIYKYEEAINLARKAKRYGFLALFDSQSIESKLKIYQQLIKNDIKDNGNIFYSRFVELEEKDIIAELAKTFDEYLDEQKAKQANAPADKPGKVFEKNIEKRVRFRNEVRLARYLLNAEFDQAKEIISKYIEDYDFKIVNATFEVLTAGGGEIGDEAKAQNAAAGSPAPPVILNMDFNMYKIHHMDNYLRLSKASLVDSFYKEMKVEDTVVPAESEKEPAAPGQKNEGVPKGASGANKETTAGSVEKTQPKDKQQQPKDASKK